MTLLYTVVCVECGASRVGRERDGEVRPFRSACANCGSTAVSVPASGADG